MRAMNFSSMLLVATVVGSVALSLASGYETFLGLLDFMPESFVGAVMATIMTFGVQVILFVISWRIANHLLDPIKSQLPSFAVWLICAFFSGYFSFYGFFQQTGGRDEEARVTVVASAHSRALKFIEDEIRLDLTASNQKELLDNPEYNRWLREDLTGLINLAGQSEQLIANKAQQTETVLLRQRQDYANQLNDLKPQRQSAEAALRIDSVRLDQSQSRFEELTSQVAVRREAIVAKRAEIQALETQYDAETRTGVGPRARQLQLDVNSAKAALEALQSEMESFQSSLDRVTETKTKLEIAAEDGTNASRVNALVAEIDRLEAQVTAITDELAVVRQGVSFNFDAQEAVLDESRRRIAELDLSAFDQLTKQCESLKGQLSSVGLTSEVQAFSCDVAGLAQTVQELRRKESKSTQFEETCVQNRAEITREDGTDAPQVDGLIDHIVRHCIGFAIKADTSDAIRSDMADLKKRRGDNARIYDQGATALFADRQGNATISAVFAFIVDLLVLLCALVGRNVGLPETARAIDLIVSLLRRPDVPLDGVTHQFTLPADHNQMTMIGPVLRRLLGDELAEYATDRDDVVYMKNGALNRLKQMRRAEIVELHDKGVDTVETRAAEPEAREIAKRRPRRPM